MKSRDKEPIVASQAIEEVLSKAKAPLSIEEICDLVWGRQGDRERGIVRVNLHRLDLRGVLEKHPMKYRLKS